MWAIRQGQNRQTCRGKHILSEAARPLLNRQFLWERKYCAPFLPAGENA
jgi:hypothetical protein